MLQTERAKVVFAEPHRPFGDGLPAVAVQAAREVLTAIVDVDEFLSTLTALPTALPYAVGISTEAMIFKEAPLAAPPILGRTGPWQTWALLTPMADDFVPDSSSRSRPSHATG